jgi:hypothetical protein
MQRFDLTSSYSRDTIETSEHGTYVLYTEAQKEINLLRTLLSDLVEAVKYTRDHWILLGCRPYLNAKAEIDKFD